MNIFGKHLVLLSTSQLTIAKAALTDAGHEVAHFASNELDKAVAAAKTTEIGKAAIDAIRAAEDTTLTGPEKREQAVKAVAPVVLDYTAKGGFKGVVADAEAFARQVIESTLADLTATKAVQIGRAILALLGIK